MSRKIGRPKTKWPRSKGRQISFHFVIHTEQLHMRSCIWNCHSIFRGQQWVKMLIFYEAWDTSPVKIVFHQSITLHNYFNFSFNKLSPELQANVMKNLEAAGFAGSNNITYINTYVANQENYYYGIPHITNHVASQTSKKWIQIKCKKMTPLNILATC